MNTKYFITLYCIFLLTSCSREAPKITERTIPVNIAIVEQEDVPIDIEAIGTVNAWTVVAIRPQVGGKLLSVHFEEGQKVKEGDLLFTIDPRETEAKMNRARATLMKDKAALDFARKKVERYEVLVKEEFVSALNFEEFKQNLEVGRAVALIDRADLTLAKLAYEYAFIHSPITGRAGPYLLDPGNLVTANDSNPLIEIRQITPAQVTFSVPQAQFQQIQNLGSIDKVVFHLFFPGQETAAAQGNLFFVDNKINTNTGTIQLKGRVENEDEALWPGEFVDVRVHLRTQSGALTFPVAALQTGRQGDFVFIVKPDMTVELIPITILTRWRGKIAVVNGLKKGDRVVTDGQINLSSGSKVEIKSEEALP